MIDKTYPVSKLANFRDLGGVRIGASQLSSNMLFRSDDMSTIDEVEAQRISDHGIKLIVDFRSKAEAEAIGRGPLGEYPIEYLNLPLLDFTKDDHNLGQQIEQVTFTNQMLGAWYAKVFVGAAPMIVEGLQAIAQTDGPAVFHCAIGKDRTGIFAASALTLMGASREEIIRDFTLTEERLPQILARLSVSQPFWSEEIILKSGALVRAEAEAMHAMFDSLSANGLEVSEVLEAAGADQALVTKLLAKHLAK